MTRKKKTILVLGTILTVLLMVSSTTAVNVSNPESFDRQKSVKKEQKAHFDCFLCWEADRSESSMSKDLIKELSPQIKITSISCEIKCFLGTLLFFLMMVPFLPFWPADAPLPSYFLNLQYEKCIENCEENKMVY